MAHDVNQSETDVAAQVRSALVNKISTERYDLWMDDSTAWHYADGTLIVEFESDFKCQIARRNLGRELAEVSQQICGSEVEVKFQVSTARKSAINEPAITQPSLAAAPTVARAAALAASGRSAAEATTSASAGQEVDYWSQFICGPSNQLAWTTAKLAVSEPGKMTPVLLHGPSGSGKSLLVRCVAQQLRGVRRMRRVVHMTSEQFTNDFTDGLRGGGLPMFRRKYRDVEALILEDIQFFVGKKSTLTEVKHTLDNLLRLDRQVIFTADRSLNDLQQLGSELVGRMRGGLTSPIFPLDEQTRFDLLLRETQAAGLDAEEPVMREIAQRVTGDGRVLSGIVKRLAAVSAVDSGRLSWEKCWSAIHDLVQATQPVVRIMDIERVVCDVFGLESNSLQSQSKTRRVSQPRMLAMFLARKYTPAAYKEIGDYFGRRRHSTVISAEKTVSNWLDEDAHIRLGKGLTVKDAIRHVESQLQVG